MRKLHLLLKLLKETNTLQIWSGFIAFFFVCSFVVWLREPDIQSFSDAMWYCYAVVTTVGFGDVVVYSHLARILSVILSVYAVLIIAITTGVVVNYFIQLNDLKKKDTVADFMDKMENLQDLSKEELAELSERIKKLRNR